jgi:hypothetical protein
VHNAANFKAKPSFVKQDERKISAVRHHRESAPRAATLKCAYCKKLGHTIQQCFELKSENKNASSEMVRAEPLQYDNCLISTIVDRDNFNSHLIEFVDLHYIVRALF